MGDGEIVNFRCNGAVIWPVDPASLVKPDLALMLKTSNHRASRSFGAGGTYARLCGDASASSRQGSRRLLWQIRRIAA